jgi:glycosyltransferase involved in cell wall biosynthesis
MNTTNIEVSIGMPVYNGEAYLAKALDSLLAQSFKDFELIISDNASTDRTQEICQEYAKKDSRICYFRQERNRGASWNFKFVLDQAQAEYFMWAACDDFWDPECLSKYVKVLNEDESVIMVFCCYRVYYHVSNKTQISYVLPSMLDNKMNNLIIRFMNPVPSIIYGLFRKKFFLTKIGKVGEFDFWDLYFLHVIASCGKIYILSDTLYYAGVKTNIKQISSLKGEKIKYWEFYKKNVRLIIKSYSFFEKILLLIIFNYFYFKLVSTTKEEIKNQRSIEA